MEEQAAIDQSVIPCDRAEAKEAERQTHLGDSGSSWPCPAPHSHPASPASASKASSMKGRSKVNPVAAFMVGTT